MTHSPPYPHVSIALIDIGLNEMLRRRDWEVVQANRVVLAAAVVPSAPSDVELGALAMPDDEHWRRGPGVVEAIDPDGVVWVTYGPRRGSAMGTSAPVRCRDHWSNIRFVRPS